VEGNDDEVTGQGDLPDNAPQGTPDGGGRGASEPNEAHTMDAEPDENADAPAEVDEAVVAALLGGDGADTGLTGDEEAALTSLSSAEAIALEANGLPEIQLDEGDMAVVDALARGAAPSAAAAAGTEEARPVPADVGEDASIAQTPRQDEESAAFAEEALPEAGPEEQGAPSEARVRQTPPAEDIHFPEESESHVDTIPADQAAIEAVLDTGEAAAEAQPAAEDSGAVDQAAMDALLDMGQSLAEAQPAAEDSGAVDQAAMDALLDDQTAMAYQAQAQASADSSDRQESGNGAAEEAGVVHGLDQADVDALLTDEDIDEPLSNMDQEAVLAGDPGTEDAALDQGDSDPFPAGGGDGETGREEAHPAAQEEQSNAFDAPLSQDMIDALVSAAGDEEQASDDLDSRDLPPEDGAEKAEGALLIQDDLDVIPAEAESRPTAARVPSERVLEEVSETAEVEPPAPSAGPRRALPKLRLPQWASALREQLRENLVKVAAASAAFVIAALSTFTYLSAQDERIPDLGSLSSLPASDLGQAMNDAARLMEAGFYPEAIERLDQAIARAIPSRQRADADFMRVEAAFRGLPAHPCERDLDPVLDAVNAFLERTPVHPKAPMVLAWKAAVYGKIGLPFAAYDIHRQIVTHYPDNPAGDAALLDAAESAMTLKQPRDAVDLLKRLFETHPASALVPKARLLLADALGASGQVSEARNLYLRIARSEPDSPLAAQALAHLGQLALESGRTEEAIAQLQARIETATTIEGNDAVYLALAQAYRAAGRMDDARRTLNDLIDFFPESESLPLALTQLAELLDAMGLREEAIRVARQAAIRYPQDPKVLYSLGSFLGDDDRRQAAKLLMSAHEAGANDPDALLQAAQYFMQVDDLLDAADAYGRLLAKFPHTPQAFQAEIGLANVDFQQGRNRSGIQRLEALEALTPEGPQHLPILLALGPMYEDLGVDARVADINRRVAALTAEPEILARTSIAMIGSGAWEEGLAVAGSVDVSKLQDETAYAFLTDYGGALMKVNPRQGAQLLDRAYRSYPQHRSVANEDDLLRAYLITNNRAGAQALVMALEEQVERNPVDAPRLTQMAVAYADYLYDRREYRAAADTYSRAVHADAGRSQDGLWAKYMRANALVQLGDFEQGALLYDQVATSAAPWAKDAAIKAYYVRLEQRLRGLPITPEPGAAQAG